MSRTITALEVQQHDPRRVNVYLDGEFAFGLPAIEAVRLRTGQVLSDLDIDALRKVDSSARAFDHAVRLLEHRPRSISEVRRALEPRYPPAAIEETLTRLENLGYLDDRAFAGQWVESRERVSPRGPRALEYELRQKGVPQPLIDAALREVDFSGSARRAAQEKVSRLRGTTRQEFRQKLGAFLARRGFDYDLVRDIVEQLIDELTEEQPGFFAQDHTNEE